MAGIDLIKAVAATAELCGARLTEAAAMMLVDDLSAYPEAAVLRALSKVRKSRARFSLGAILEHIDAMDGRPGPDEAWAMLPKSERDTVVWTEEMSQAWGVAAPLVEAGDKFGARRAFVEAYERLIEEARDAGRPPQWVASLGDDKHGREPVIAAAVQRGLLSAGQAQMLLPGADIASSPIAALLNGGNAAPLIAAQPAANRDVAREHLKRLASALKKV